MESITELNNNDVLCGRGAALVQFAGNIQFREITQEHSMSYRSAENNDAKGQIARRVVQQIRDLGGRFLRLDDENARPLDCVIKDGTWVLADENAVLDKTKQSLRQLRVPPKQVSDPTPASSLPPIAPSLSSLSIPIIAPGMSMDLSSSAVGNPAMMNTVFSTLPPDMVGNIMPFGVAELSMLTHLNQCYAAAAQHASTTANIPIELIGSLFHRMSASSYSSSGRVDSSFFLQPSFAPPGNGEHETLALPEGRINEQMMNQGSQGDCEEETEEVQSALLEDLPPVAGEDDVSEFLMSTLAISGRRGFTEQELANERAGLTGEEKSAALSDIFGKLCDYNDRRMEKKARRDLCPESISFLVNQMRMELEQVPEREKLALMEARKKCSADEFSDARLGLFLRCEGMNPKLAAHRFVNYWNCRREVFGSADYFMPMTLTGALRDDIEAIEAGVFCLLPKTDVSGRPLLYLEPARHTSEGYTSASLLRAVWYTIEVAARTRTTDNISSSAVQVMWDLKTSLFDYDRRVYDRMNYFDTSAWPVKIAAFHDCCPPAFMTQIIKPLMFALKNKESRSRTLFHNVPPSDIIDILAKYGIEKDMLPTYVVGGTLELNLREWITERRAIELEEIE